MLIILHFGPGQKTQTERIKKKITQSKPRKVKSTQIELATSEKPIQNDQGLKICAQSGSGERKLTQTEPIKKKLTQTELATSEKPIQNDWGFKICAQSGSGERKHKLNQSRKKITQTEPATSEKPIKRQ